MWPFKKKKKEINNADFEIVEFPATKKYCAKYKGWYLRQFYITGIVSLDESLDFATIVHSKGEAEKLITQYREQRFKAGAIIHKITT